MIATNTNKVLLKDGSNIVVIGGGPSGSFFSYFALKYAEKRGLEINIDIIEAKNFNCLGPAGCNNCGGIVSESLIQMLSAEGIILPSEVIRKGIETYTLHLEQGRGVIEAPIDEQRIASMFRGLGPSGCAPNGLKSFDDHLLELCISKGANVILDRVVELERKKDGILVKTKSNIKKEYDLVVGAVGLNQEAFRLFHKICPAFVHPKTTRTHICEIKMDSGLINEYFGNSMHVFLLNLPNIEFGALIPKANYVTLVLLGKDIDKKIAGKFLNSDPVKKCFPPKFDLESNISCRCYPHINIKGAKSAYDNRVVLIGDSSTSKLYKNGIGAAYITAKSVAHTAIFQGISKENFKKYFQPVCNNLEFDNSIGKFIFMVTSIIQKSAVLKSSMLQVVIDEQQNERHRRKMSSILWDTFTGSAPYKDIFWRFLNPRILFTLIWNTMLAIQRSIKNKI